jgi:hypothetical protein
MLYIGAAGLLLGATQSRRFGLGLLILFSVIAAGWFYIVKTTEGFSFLHSAREGVYAAWATSGGCFAGLLLDRLVLHRRE